MKSNMKINFNTDGRTDGLTKMVVTVSEYCCGRNSARSGKKRVSLVVGLIAALLLAAAPAHAGDPTPTPGPTLTEALWNGLAQAGAIAGTTADTVVNVGAVTVTCSTRNRWQRDHWNDGTVGADEWWFTAKHYYQYCAWPHSADSVRLLKSEYRYDFEGDSQTCDLRLPHGMKYVKFNSYFSDSAGRNFNPDAKAVTCSTTSHRTVFVYYDTDVQLWTSDGHAPKFRTNYDLVRTTVLADTHHNGTLGGTLRSCTGRGSALC
jgi:hypothetical protein